MAFGGVDDREVADRCGRAARAGQIARIARRTDSADVRGAQARAAQERHPRGDVTAGAMVHEDGLAAEALLVQVLVNPVGDDVQSLVPADALPLVLAALADALERPLRALLIVDALDQVQAAHAQPAVGNRIQRVALDLAELAVLDIHQNAARVVASGSRVGIGTGDGIAVLLPLPLALVVGLAVDAVEELLIIKQHRTSSSSFFRTRLLAFMRGHEAPACKSHCRAWKKSMTILAHSTPSDFIVMRQAAAFMRYKR